MTHPRRFDSRTSIQPDRIRAFEAAQDAYERRVYRLVARHRGTGELAVTHGRVSVQHPWQRGS